MASLTYPLFLNPDMIPEDPGNAIVLNTDMIPGDPGSTIIPMLSVRRYEMATFFATVIRTSFLRRYGDRHGAL